MATLRLDQLLASPKHHYEPLPRLLAQASLREALSAQLRALLPPELRAHCEVASVQRRVLTLLAPNAAWATRLRFATASLLPQLNRLADFASVGEIRIRIAPQLPQEPSAPPTGHLTGAGPSFQPRWQRQPPDAASLEGLARDLEEQGLRDAILRLARHGKPPTDAQP